MATLVLSVAGSLVGGPVGQAIGAVIGNVIDRDVLFKPKGREGPRLTELAVQTSSYGTQIPRLFGTIRVAGTVIWATDLVEHRSTTAGGKGQPGTTDYSYTASFAVALSGRPIQAVARIWADGKLLRGSAGDFKSVVGGFRLHAGDEDQAADPLIAAAEGAGLAPAHRGLAYAVFEDLALADFGNRIPALTFEVEADAGEVTAGGMLAEIAGGDITGGEATQALTGFSAYGASVRAVAETLAGADGGWFAADEDRLTLMRGDGEATDVEDSGVRASGGAGTRASRAIAAADSAPRSLTLTHYDPARDYQIGVQRAVRPGAGTREARMELPAVLDAGTAKTIAAAALARLDVERERRSVALGWSALGVRPGERVTIAGSAGLWRVDRWTLEAMVVTLECVGVAPAPLAAEASPGRVMGAADVALGATLVHAFELPPLDDTPATAPRLAIAAAGTEAGWRSAALLVSTDGGERWDPAGRTALPAVLGQVTMPPGAAPATLTDAANTIEVELAHSGMELADADDAGLDAGANLAMAGDELIQFGRAEPIGGNRWRLGRLRRGRRGTETAIGGQAEGDRFVMIAAAALKVIDLPLGALGATVQVLATGAGDDGEGAAAPATLDGVSVVPPSPVHLGAAVTEDGATEVRWIRRSRAGWRWTDGVDAPLAEEAERYRVTIAPEGGPERTEEVDEPRVLLTADDREGACQVEVRQAGSFGLSPPATIILPPLGES